VVGTRDGGAIRASSTTHWENFLDEMPRFGKENQDAVRLTVPYAPLKPLSFFCRGVRTKSVYVSHAFCTDSTCLSRRELVRGHNGLQHLGHKVPEGLVLLVQEDHEARRLRVEARGDVEDGLLGDFGDLLVGNGSVFVELVDGAAVLDGVQEGLLAGHCCGSSGEGGLLVCLRGAG
jgi:hypothetical protein